MIFHGRNTANFPIQVSWETGDENCVCDVTVFDNIREVTHDVNGRQQTAKTTSDFQFFSSNP